MSDGATHWDRVYRTRRADEVSWYRPHLEQSLALIAAVTTLDARIVDVGAGESTLVDDLLLRGYRNVAALDVSAAALSAARARLGAGAGRVTWLCGDVRTFPFAADGFDLWHDRAVFHFLTDPRDRAAYVRQVRRAVRPGGHAIVATFGPEGPPRCSGLDVRRYDAAALHAEFGEAFALLHHATELHRTPAGAVQPFTYCCFRVAADAAR